MLKKQLKPVDLTYKKYTNKDYLVDEINNKIKSFTIDRKEFKKDLRKLKNNTLLELLTELQFLSYLRNKKGNYEINKRL